MRDLNSRRDRRRSRTVQVLASISSLWSCVGIVAARSTESTYQECLMDGPLPATGRYQTIRRRDTVRHCADAQ